MMVAPLLGGALRPKTEYECTFELPIPSEVPLTSPSETTTKLVSPNVEEACGMVPLSPDCQKV